MTALRLAGESRVSGPKATSYLGDTISISTRRKVRPGGARRLRRTRHARPAERQSLSAAEGVTTGFFHMEHATIGGREVHLALAKNPNGYTEVLRALLGDGQPKHMLLGLNDRASNQQPDVSWIWDVDFESLRGLVPAAVLSGNRATDLEVRLKYAGWLGPEESLDGSPATGSTAATDIVVEPDPLRALQLALEHTPPGQPIWVVSTNLVLWQLRSWLRRQGYVGALRDR
jgi:lipid II isoglutaminyl synthase (glutamine-hydrolysing)